MDIIQNNVFRFLMVDTLEVFGTELLGSLV